MTKSFANGTETADGYINDLIERLLDAQQDINLAANTTMDQSLCDASALIDEVERVLRSRSAPPAPEVKAEAMEVDFAIGLFRAFARGVASKDVRNGQMDRDGADSWVEHSVEEFRKALQDRTPPAPSQEMSAAEIHPGRCGPFYQRQEAEMTIEEYVAVVDQEQAGLKQLTADDLADALRFLNRLRILNSIDQHELVEAGALPPNDMAWELFVTDPVRWLMRCDDERLAKFFAIIRRRETR